MLDDFLQHHLLPHAFPGTGRHAAPDSDYATQFADFNALASVGAFGFGLSQLILLAVVLKSIKGGAKASDNPWEGAEGLEWSVPSPAPYHTFETAPHVK